MLHFFTTYSVMSSISEYEETRQSNINALLEEYNRTFGHAREQPLPQDENHIPKRRRNFTNKILQSKIPTRRSVRIKSKNGEMVGEEISAESLENEYKSRMPVRHRTYTPRIVLRNAETRYLLKPEDVTKEHIDMVSYRSSGKSYDPANGTTCHQCRQKTIDTKSVCRNSACGGIRGQFCGFCLQNRYGEDVATALKDPEWSCPPCRGICNCSICRTREGKMPTGILTPYVKNDGYNNVKEYLEKHEDFK